MSAFGTEVKRRLAAQGKDASWLHIQTGISNSTISNWFTTANDVHPLPSTVARVAKALGCEIEDLAPHAGYTVRVSKNAGERAQRRADIIAARPRLAQRIDQFEQLDAHDEDVLLSMIELFFDATLRPRQPPKGSQ